MAILYNYAAIEDKWLEKWPSVTVLIGAEETPVMALFPYPAGDEDANDYRHYVHLDVMSRYYAMTGRHFDGKIFTTRGNVEDFEELIREYGCDSLRLYELFVGPPMFDILWDDRGIDGVFRFISKVWKMALDSLDEPVSENDELIRLRHKMIHEVTERLDDYALNTAVASLMTYYKALSRASSKTGVVDKMTMEAYIKLLAPFAPHVAEELWEMYGHGTSVFGEAWPSADEAIYKDPEKKIVVQINGKARLTVMVPLHATDEEILAIGREAASDRLTGPVIREIYVTDRIMNFVTE